MFRLLTRRSFLQRSAIAAAGMGFVRVQLGFPANAAPANNKLNLGIIGVAGRGGDNLRGGASENIVALCDVDDHNLAAAAQKFPAWS